MHHVSNFVLSIHKKFAQDNHGKISGVCMLQYFLQLYTMLHLTVLLMEHDQDAKGTFSEQELQEFIQDVIDSSAQDFDIDVSNLCMHWLIQLRFYGIGCFSSFL
jgi:hypothetical protein